MSAWTSDELTSVGAAEERVIVSPRRGGERATLRRRSFLRGALVGGAGVVIGIPMIGCSQPSPDIEPLPISEPSAVSAPSPVPEPSPVNVQAGREPEPTPARPTATGSKVLLAYFSRAGENYYYGGRTRLEVGNTEVLAGMVSRLVGCDVHRVHAVGPYPDDYSETVSRNVREQEANARPAIANPLASLERYDIVLLGSPIWNVRAPMIMSTLAESFDFTGKTIIPFTTHAGSGLGTTARDYAASCPGATIGEGIAVRGEEVSDAGAAVESWLTRIGLLTK